MGIDPGTTKAYAIFNIKKELIACKSKKELSLNDLIAEISGYGKVLVVGTDRKKVPEFVEKFATKIGAKLIAPEYDLEVKEKLELTKDYEAKNNHEKDAVACALNAYKSISNIIARIESFAKLYNKERIKDKIIELVILHDTSIKLAADLVEKPEEEYVKESIKVLEKKIFLESDFLRLLNKLREKEYEIKLIKRQNERINSELMGLMEKIELNQGIDNIAKSEKLFNRLHKRVNTLYKALDERSVSLRRMRERFSRLNSIISKIGKDFVLVKRLENFGQMEFRRKEKILNINYGDVLLVNTVSVYSEKVVDMLKDKVSIVLFRKKTGEEIRKKFIFIDANNVEIYQDMYFAVANKEQIKYELSRMDRLHRVIEEYKEERRKMS